MKTISQPLGPNGSLKRVHPFPLYINVREGEQCNTQQVQRQICSKFTANMEKY